MIEMLTFGALGWLLATILWLILMNIIWVIEFRKEHLQSNGNRSDEIKYHNEAIYRDFEHFFQVTLAIVGGVIYLGSREALSSFVGDISLLLDAARSLQIMATFIFFVFIVFHQKSKIMRWEHEFKYWEPIFWQEYWICCFMWSLSASLVFGFIPNIIK